jgi:predicted small integral membrane protein
MFSPALDRSYWVHRRLGLILAIPLLLWCLSGFAYLWAPVASETAAPFYHSIAQPITQNAINRLPADFLPAHQQSELKGLAFMAIDGDLYYQLEFIGESGFRYYLAADGTAAADGAYFYAAAIASSLPFDGAVNFEHIGPVSPSVRHLYLPPASESTVFSVPFKNKEGLQRYVDTRTGRILGETTRGERLILNWIHYAHHMAWLGSEGSVHRWLIVAFGSLACAVVGLAGLILFGLLLKLRISPAHVNRRLHRLFGLGLSLPLLVFGWTGFIKAVDRNSSLHDQILLIESNLEPAVTGLQLQRFLQNIALGTFTRLDIIRFEEGFFYRVFTVDESGDEVVTRTFNAATLGRVSQADQRHAESLFRSALSLTNHSRPQTHSLRRVHSFSREYPSAHRVLPIYRGISTDSGLTERFPVFYIDTLGNRMIHYSTHSKRMNESRFARWHLFGLVDHSHTRITLLGLATLGLVALVLLGVMNALRSKRRGHR